MSKPSYRGAPLHIYIPGVLGLACRGSSRGHTDFHPHLARLRTAASGLPATCKPHPCHQFRNVHMLQWGERKIYAPYFDFPLLTLSLTKGSLLNWHRYALYLPLKLRHLSTSYLCWQLGPIKTLLTKKLRLQYFGSTGFS